MELISAGGIAIVLNGIISGFILGWNLRPLLKRPDGDRSRTWFRAGDYRRHIEEVATELLRAELRAGRCRDTYAYNVGQNGIIKVATARQYHFAVLAGVKDFWKCVPPLGEVPEPPLSAAKLDEDLANADRDFGLNDIERDIISKHMFPLTPHLPSFRESVIVGLADKWCAIAETFRIDISSYLIYRVNFNIALANGEFEIGETAGTLASEAS